MNILILTTNSPYYEVTGPALGGAEVSLRILAEELVKTGNSVFYLTRSNFGKKTRIINGVNVSFFPVSTIPLLGKKIGLIRSRNRDLLEKQYGKQIRRIVDDNDIDLIHTYGTYPDTFVALKIAGEKGIPVCQRVAGRATIDDASDGTDGKRNLSVLNGVSLLLPISGYLKEEIRKNPNIDNKTEIIDIGIDLPGEDKVGSGGKRPDGKLKLISVSSFKNVAKRQDILIEGLRDAMKENDGIGMTFIGDGPNLDKCKNLAEKFGITDRIDFRGRCTREETLLELRDSDIFVHCTEHEGLGKSVLEALSFGKPVIVSNVPAINEYVIDRENGILAENTASAFTEKILLLSRDENLRESLGIAARSYSMKRFDPEKNVHGYIEIFNRLTA